MVMLRTCKRMSPKVNRGRTHCGPDRKPEKKWMKLGTRESVREQNTVPTGQILQTSRWLSAQFLTSLWR